MCAYFFRFVIPIGDTIDRIVRLINADTVRLRGVSFNREAGGNLMPWLTYRLNPDSPDGLGRQDRSPRKHWQNCQFLLSPVGSVRIWLLDPA